MSQADERRTEQAEQAGQAEGLELLATPPDTRDVSGELAAPPRRKLPWLSLALAGGVIATCAFAGGVWYQKDQAPSASATPRASAGGGQTGGGAAGAQGGTGRRNGQGQGQGQNQGQGQRPAGGQAGFTRGTVKAVDGNTVYLTDAGGNTVKVTTGDATKVQLNKEGKVADLLPGQSVTVVGTPDANGGYTASQLVEGAGGFAGGAGGAGRGSTTGG